MGVVVRILSSVVVMFVWYFSMNAPERDANMHTHHRRARIATQVGDFRRNLLLGFDYCLVA